MATGEGGGAEVRPVARATEPCSLLIGSLIPKFRMVTNQRFVVKVVQCSRSRRRTGTANSGRVLVGDDGSGSEFVGSVSCSGLAALRGGAGVADRSWQTS